MKRALLAGASGFAGRALAALLVAEGAELHGLGRGSAPDAWPGTWHTADIRDAEQVDAAIAAARPDAVFHLAGTRDGTLEDLLAVHVLGLEHVLDAVGRRAADARVVIVGSSAEYGAVEGLVGEHAPLHPLTPYGISKAAQGLLAAARGAVHARTFNLVGPDLPDALAPGAFARALAEIEAGQREPVLRTGPLGTCRDYVDVRDAARAWVALATPGTDGAYNVCSGTATAIGDVLAMLIRLSGAEVQVQEPPAADARDVPSQTGDPSRLREATGWSAEIPLERSLVDLLDGWRSRVAQTT